MKYLCIHHPYKNFLADEKNKFHVNTINHEIHISSSQFQTFGAEEVDSKIFIFECKPISEKKKT